MNDKEFDFDLDNADYLEFQKEYDNSLIDLDDEKFESDYPEIVDTSEGEADLSQELFQEYILSMFNDEKNISKINDYQNYVSYMLDIGKSYYIMDETEFNNQIKNSGYMLRALQK